MIGAVAAAAAVVAGAATTSGLIYIVADTAGKPPAAAVAALAFICAAIAAGVLPDLLPDSRWRVPQSWARLGRTWYGVAFGVALGIGFLTAIPSAGFYVLVFAAMTMDSYAQVAAGLLAFGVARAASVVFVAVWSLRRPQPWLMYRLENFSTAVIPLEMTVLVMLGVTLAS